MVREVEKQGAKIWKQTSGYHQSSLAFTTMYRIKTLFGYHLKARIEESQAVEAFVQSVVLNRITFLGLPDYYPISVFGLCKQNLRKLHQPFL